MPNKPPQKCFYYTVLKEDDLSNSCKSTNMSCADFAKGLQK